MWYISGLETERSLIAMTRYVGHILLLETRTETGLGTRFVMAIVGDMIFLLSFRGLRYCGTAPKAGLASVKYTD
jgi:hypothetical protein